MILIETERLVMRNFQHDDAGALHRIIVQKEASPYAAYDYPWPTDAEKIREITDWFAGGDRYLAVCLKSSQQVIGFIGLNPGEDEITAEYDLGYSFDFDYHGQGYASEACRAVIDYAFQSLQAERITSGTAEENGPSYRLLERLGFQKVGEGPTSFRQNAQGEPITFNGCAFVLERK
jgi:[ribosomal protein S5]-alanine N-acetyltransferase